MRGVPTPPRPVYLQAGSVIHWNLLVQIAICVLPAAAAIALGDPGAGGRWIYASLLVLLAIHFLEGNRVAFSTLLVGCIPPLMLLRNFFYFHGLTAMLAAGLLLWVLKAPNEVRSRPLIVFFAFATFYWWISFLLTDNYAANLRILELVFSAANVCLLGRFRSFLSTALLGIWLSVASMGASLLPYGSRLGMAEIGDVSLGNPITFGIPACLVFLLSIADRGQWLMLQNRVWLRLLVNLTAAFFLLLSTSRGSWLIAGGGFIVLWTLGRAQKIPVALWMAPTVLVAIAVVQSERGSTVAHYFSKAVAPEYTLSERTTGRYEQWAAFPTILADSPVWGHGPGLGVATNVQYTGSGAAWHSLYLQMGVETGILGLAIAAALVTWLLWSGFTHWRLCGQVVPLLGVLCFLGIGISVSGLDAASGVFLGLGFLGRDFAHMAVISAGPASCTLERNRVSA